MRFRECVASPRGTNVTILRQNSDTAQAAMDIPVVWIRADITAIEEDYLPQITQFNQIAFDTQIGHFYY